MKVIGAVCIILATTWIGFEWAKRLQDRPRQLRQLKVALQSLEAEIVYGLTPLNEACSRLSTQLKPPLSWFFVRFSEQLQSGRTSVQEAWEESLVIIRKHSALQKGEIEILKQFGAMLGRHDREHQQKQIKLAIVHLEREESEAVEIQHKYETMIKSLGFLSGLLIVILLI
ncbi:stage III sporulation protein SpoIIIAB [Alkalihalobacillus sp. AL-G]|uniref:stage III sporulation protein SpoIIIAB n=1 Tax=Alkalihalobacillus sp. AL-G TaxID=2926399 RepID=UPI00272A28C8|nr:stage III sporulation protein SpoIIIAB [Alkalihalobacillus sp. AL-G]WLD92001.1 stage III sporulation protein SpoIIIAB [Alkalihalobacillus sp. AL-G]